MNGQLIGSEEQVPVKMLTGGKQEFTYVGVKEVNKIHLSPLQMISVSLCAWAMTARSSGFEPASRPNPYSRPKSSTSSTTWRC